MNVPLLNVHPGFSLPPQLRDQSEHADGRSETSHVWLFSVTEVCSYFNKMSAVGPLGFISLDYTGWNVLGKNYIIAHIYYVISYIVVV